MLLNFLNYACFDYRKYNWFNPFVVKLIFISFLVVVPRVVWQVLQGAAEISIW